MTTVAFFFAMRSCEYSSVKVKGRTELLMLRDMKFYKNKRVLNSRFDNIERDATSVTITFRNQKNGDRGAMITQYRNNYDLCPVKTLAKMVKTKLNYKGTNMNSHMNTVMIDDTIVELKSEHVLKRIRITLISVMLFHIIAHKARLDQLYSDITHVFVTAYTNEKITCIAGLEFDKVNHSGIIIVRKALYALASKAD